MIQVTEVVGAGDPLINCVQSLLVVVNVSPTCGANFVFITVRTVQ